MTEVDLINILKIGYDTWKKNLIICMPFIINIILIGILGMIIFFVTLFQIFMPIINAYLADPTLITSSEFFYQLPSLLMDVLPTLIYAIIIFIILASFISSFFLAGAIGMAKEALLTGKTNLSYMWEYGKRKMFSILGANIVLAVLISISFIFVIPGLITLFSNLGSDFTTPEMIGGLISLLFGFLIMVIYIIVIAVIFSLVQYAIVIDDLRAIEGIKKGFKVFMYYNKINVVAMWILIMVITIPLSLTQMIPFVGTIVYLIVYIIIIAPLATLWWSKLYISVTKQ